MFCFVMDESVFFLQNFNVGSLKLPYLSRQVNFLMKSLYFKDFVYKNIALNATFNIKLT